MTGLKINRSMPANPKSLANLQKWQPGQSGNPNGHRRDARKEADDLGFFPIKEAVARYRDPKTPNASKDYCLGLVMDRVFPKLKAIELKGGADALSQVLINIVAGTLTVNDAPETVVDDQTTLVSTVEPDQLTVEVTVPTTFEDDLVRTIVDDDDDSA